MTLPATIYAGDTVTWTDPYYDSNASALVYYLRTNYDSGATISGTSSGKNGWIFTLASATSTNFALGNWVYQARATVSNQPATVRTGSFVVAKSLAYSGSLGAVDLRSQEEIDLENVETAIRALTSGAQEYRIGTASGGRMVKRADLAELIKWRDRLKSAVLAKKRADSIANGFGDPRKLFVRWK